MNLLGDVDGDEVSLVKRAANRRRFALLKGDNEVELDAQVADILSVPWAHEGAMMDELRAAGVEPTVLKAAVAAIRLLKGVEDDLPNDLREPIEKLSARYPTENPPLNQEKADRDGDGDDDDSPEGDTDHDFAGATQKRDFSEDERDNLAGKGKALPDGSYPIENKGDLKNAIQAYGRAKDKGRAKAWIIRRAKALGATSMLPDNWVSKGDDETDSVESVEVNDHIEKGGTVAEESHAHAVPVRKEDGTWDLSNVSADARPFYEAVLKSNDTLAEENKALKERVEKQEDTLRTRDFIAKAEGDYKTLGSAEEIGTVLKAASRTMSAEDFEKLEGILKSANERIEQGDLFKEQGRSSGLNDGATTDAWSQIEKAAGELVQKGEGLTQEQAVTLVLKARPELYAAYLTETAGGVS